MVKVSIVMPVYNGIRYLKESIESIQNQTFVDWEFIIINEFGSSDGSVETIKRYAKKDKRIILIQNNEKLGLAESLNIGIKQAKGEYIARADSDDISYPDRLQKQVEFMDNHPEITLCGTLQKVITPNGDSILETACDTEELKSDLLFGCEISHCSVMLRKKDLIQNNWFYDSNFLSEDFELWTRIMPYAKFVNLNQVLVGHRWGYDNISIQKGEALKQETREINERTLRLLEIDTSNIDLMLLSGWRDKPKTYAKINTSNFLKEGFELLELIKLKNLELKIFSQKALLKTLYKRWNWICETCNLDFKNYNFEDFSNIRVDPIISVIMPVYNSVSHLRECIDSIIEQSFTNWEFLIINEYESDDGSAEIIKAYSNLDSRIIFIQNDIKLGLGDSLNKGFKMARGEYLARIDADDLADPYRFEKQIDFMKKNPDIGVCGTYQHHFGPGINWVHEPPIKPEQCRANLLFYCDICHSTLMIRKDIFINNNLFYDNNYLAEDFELWTRAVSITKFATIPEVLGEYRENGENITLSKIENLQDESGHIVAKNLKDNLKLDIPYNDHKLFNGWQNSFFDDINLTKSEKERLLLRFKEILLNIWDANNRIKYYDTQSLLNIISAKWKWAKYNESWHNPQNAIDINEIFDSNYRPSLKFKIKRFLRDNPTTKQKAKKVLKKIVKPLIRPIRARFEGMIRNSEQRIFNHISDMTWDRMERTFNHINDMTWNRTQFVIRKVDSKVWQAEKRIIKVEYLLTQQMFLQNMILYNPTEKIRILFIFQVPSFWPSMESFYNECLNDDKFDVKLICYDEQIDITIKTDSSRDYLVNNNIDFISWEDFDLEEYNPHIVVLQTPYDTNRRVKYRSAELKSKGYRVIYIPYGIEISKTENAKEAHFDMDVIKNAWSIYTFSTSMLKDYKMYSINGHNVKALGLPRFDGLYFKNNLTLDNNITRLINGRKVVLWKVHFPKIINENNKMVFVTPYIEEYLKFAEIVSEYKDLFFIFMPHPRFKEFNNNDTIKNQVTRLINRLEKKENVYIDLNDDYRYSLVNADCIIIDRSAVMVEAGAVGVPVLYMSNPDFFEPMTDAITPLIESYYQGKICEDMIDFIDMFQKGEDPKKYQREFAFKECIPYFDGKCGFRIKEDIISNLNLELEKLIKNRLGGG